MISEYIEMDRKIRDRIDHVNELFNDLPGEEPSWWWEPVNYVTYDVTYRFVDDYIHIKFYHDEEVSYEHELPLELLLNGTDQELLNHERERGKAVRVRHRSTELEYILLGIKRLSSKDRMFVADCIDQKRLDGWNVVQVARAYVEAMRDEL